MEEDAFARSVKIISAKTGLRLDGHDPGTLRKVAAARMAFHGLSSPDEYGDLLEADTPKGRLEREELISLLTVGESYFFRDKGQFNLLRNMILPELIELRKAGRMLKIWSAGCATGEEPYSLAILLHEMIPDIADWRILVLGTDIKDEFLEKARKAVYRDWSFRTVPEEVRKKYFTEKDGWSKLDPIIKNMVTFRRGNLLDGVFTAPAGEPPGADLILCRNVFIYYRRKIAAAIANKMAESLREGGYLITGHWELFSPPDGILTPRVFPGSLVYQRLAEFPVKAPRLSAPPVLPAVHIPPRADTVLRISHPASPAADVPRERQDSLGEAEGLFKNGHYRRAAALFENELRKTPDDFRILCLTAHAYANLGDHGRAMECLRKAVNVNPLSAEPYYLLASIAEENGDAASAKENLGKVIYLEPASVAAYLDLAAIHESAGDVAKARKLRMAALDALRKLPKGSIVEPHGTTADEFIHFVELLLLG